MRIVLSLLFGAIAAFLIIMAVEWVDAWFYPLPGLAEGSDTDADAAATIIATMPLPAKIIVVLGWLLGALGGAWMALRISDRQWTGWVIVAVVIAGGVTNLFALPHPLWMQACTFLMPIAGGAIATRWHRKYYPGEALLG
ncbi:hypothetical protein [Sphingomonas immobilis]|uniref:Uncharacterized protein n=1 Tax=Sphingomonas immobilis TaxID=3063997 RepID=A0ABT9A214_9SPHN|nr:hypothetical protein [Sphingomonas sp. CA1-15]MDO7843881.1 hypothetical protein [Sphingomonas sp. CA1-15]